MKLCNLEQAVLQARKLAEERLAKGEAADEFVEISETDGFKIYVTAGKTIQDVRSEAFHANPRDVFMLVLEGEVEFTFEEGDKQTAKAGEFFLLPKNLKHKCAFKKMTVAIEGIYEKGL